MTHGHARGPLSAAVLVSSLLAGSAPAQTMHYGLSLYDSVSCGQLDDHALDAQAGDVLIAHVTECLDWGGVCGGACLCFDQCLELYDPNGVPVAINCSPPSNNNASDRRRTQIGPVLLPVDGQYNLRVRDTGNNGRGNYTLFVQRTSAPELTQLLADGDDVLRVLNTCGEVQTFEFEATAGARAILHMTPDTGAVIPRLALYEQVSGQLVDLPGSGLIDRVLPSTGWYTLLAHNAVDTTGAYRLSCQLVTPPNFCVTAPNSVGSGAHIGSAGSTSLQAADLSLVATHCPAFQPGLIFYSATPALGFPFGDGFLCLGGTLIRLPPVSTSLTGMAVRPIDYSALPASGQISAGSTWYWQFWYRDPLGPGGSGFNFTEGLALSFEP